jgi:CheY-like chemotaxis protein
MSASFKTPTMKSVLVIDDDPVMCSVVQRVLEGDGFAVAAAGDAQTGLSRFGELNPDLVIVDILMPGK